MSFQRRRISVALAAGVLVAGMSGCMLDTDVLRKDVLNQRKARFEAWRSSREGKNDRLQTLSGPLTVHDSILVALGNSREIQTAVLQREIADARVTEAYAAALPSADVSANYTRMDKVNNFGNASVGDVNNYTLAGTITQPLYRGGAIGAGIRAAKIFTVLTDEQLRGTYQRVIYEVRKGYYDARMAW